MKVNSNLPIQTYRQLKNHLRQEPADQTEHTTLHSEKTDQLEISRSGAFQADLTRLTRSLMSQIGEPASPQRIEQLHSQVQNHTYYVPTGKLADAIMRYLGGN